MALKSNFSIFIINCLRDKYRQHTLKKSGIFRPPQPQVTMKTRIAFALLLSAVLVSSPFSAHAQEMTKQDYLEKSRKQKTAGFILLGGGVAVLGIGAIVSATNAVGYTVSCIGLNCSQAAEEGIQTGGAIMLVGGLAVVGSIPLFVSAGNNRKKPLK